MATAVPTGRSQDGEARCIELVRREITPQVERLERLRTRQRHLLALETLITVWGAINVAVLLVRIEPAYGMLGGLLVAAAGILLLHRTQQRYLNEVRGMVVPALCEAIGEGRRAIGPVPGPQLDLLEWIGLLAPHQRCTADDPFEGPIGRPR